MDLEEKRGEEALSAARNNSSNNNNNRTKGTAESDGGSGEGEGSLQRMRPEMLRFEAPSRWSRNQANPQHNQARSETHRSVSTDHPRWRSARNFCCALYCDNYYSSLGVREVVWLGGKWRDHPKEERRTWSVNYHLTSTANRAKATHRREQLVLFSALMENLPGLCVCAPLVPVLVHQSYFSKQRPKTR